MVESKFTKIKKRDGRLVDWNQSKITNAIFKALVATEENEDLAEPISDKVVSVLNERLPGRIPGVEQIQDIVEEVLQKDGLGKTAHAYHNYRQKRAEIREAKWWLLNYEIKTKLNANALKVLESRYLNKNDEGKIVETPQELFKRVAQNIASAEKIYKPDLTDEEVFQVEEKFYHMMASLEFLPNTPTLINAGNVLQMLSACFVIPIPDSMEGIFEAVKQMALIQQGGGGTGFSFSRLRPAGDIVKSTKGAASGPLSFMNVFNAATETIKQAGVRRGANMGILRVDHPDILKFITSKTEEGVLSNFNISVAITDEFMEKAKKNENYNLINPRTGQIWGELNAKTVFDFIVHHAWLNGEPGVIFIDNINKDNPTPRLGEIESTNPCVVGDTLVAVADGRNYVTIKQLAEEGKDVPVYCFGEGRVQIKMGRFPRKTRDSSKVWKVTLDDGSFIIATEDHKFRTRENTVVKLKDFKTGDRLMPFYKFQYSATGKRTMYWGINQNNGQRARAEHRMIAEFYINKEIKRYPQEVVHHINSHGLDNRIENLEVLSANKHDKFHQTGERNVMKGKWWEKLSEEEKNAHRKIMSQKFSGENNGMFGRKHKRETRELISRLRREYYIKHPEAKLALSQKITQVFQNTDLAERISLARTKYGYAEVYCLNCGKVFYAKENTPRQFCSKTCRAIFVNKTRDTSTVRESKRKNREKIREGLYKIGLEFTDKHNRIPNYIEFKKLANTFGYSGDLRSTFGGYRNFKEQLTLSNHRVASIEYYGHEDVYNITVDDFHTVAYITNINAKTRITKKPLISGIITSQCSELPLLPYESCNLGSINLVKMVKRKDGKYEINWEKIRTITHDAVRFLDNVIEVNRYPIPQIEEMTKGNRKIGLGVMGWADMLVLLEIPYNSKEGFDLAEKVMKFIQDESKNASAALAEERSVFRNFKGSIYDDPKMPKIRNATTTVIAPTGTISIIAGCSFGIEPYYAISFVRKHVLGGAELTEVNPLFEEIAKRDGFYSEELMGRIAEKGSVKNMEGVPEKWQKIFVTALDISYDDHIKMQAAFQRYIDNSVSKTINFPFSATEEEVKNAYLMAYQLGCKGITIYRSESRKQQVLNIKGNSQKEIPVLEEKITEKEVPLELKNPSPEVPNLPPGSCPTCSV